MATGAKQVRENLKIGKFVKFVAKLKKKWIFLGVCGFLSFLYDRCVYISNEGGCKEKTSLIFWRVGKLDQFCKFLTKFSQIYENAQNTGYSACPPSRRSSASVRHYSGKRPREGGPYRPHPRLQTRGLEVRIRNCVEFCQIGRISDNFSKLLCVSIFTSYGKSIVLGYVFYFFYSSEGGMQNQIRGVQICHQISNLSNLSKFTKFHKIKARRRTIWLHPGNSWWLNRTCGDTAQ